MSAWTETDTIAAIASAAGGGVGVIRMSGPRARAIAEAHFEGLPAAPKARRMYHGWWRDLDEGLCVVFEAPRSYTGEDVVELHLHGGALSLRRALDACVEAGCRLADPGEFTRRAFLNGRMDLTRAEAVADLIAARTDRALEQARHLLKGELYEVAMGAREALLELRAAIEVNIDFVDEDVPLMDPEGLATRARGIAAELAALVQTWRSGHLYREGARVALVGRPNAGKSSLFNALLKRDRAIVTDVPGTTRDTLAESLDVLGVPIVLIDTAGLRETADQVEAAGVDRAHEAARAADLLVHVVDGTESAAPEVPPSGPPVVRVRSKADLPPADPAPEGLPVSARTGEGLDALERALVAALGGDEEAPIGLTIGHERHRIALARAVEALERCAALLEAREPPELAAVDLQDATDALAELVGLTTIEDMLDRLFSRFCIGK